MDITEHTRNTVIQALRHLQWSQSDLADKMGENRSWVTKLLNGTRKRLRDAEVERLEKALGVKFLRLVENQPIPDLAVKLGRHLDQSQELQEITSALLRLQEKSLYHSLPFLPTKDLVEFGEEIMRASHEDPDKAGKVGRIAVVWLAKRLEELEKA